MKPKSYGFWYLEFEPITKEASLFDEDYLHYDIYKQKWVNIKDYKGYWLPGAAPCHSYKAALRHLRKHNEIPKGTKFRLVSKFRYCDLYLIKK